MTQQPTFTQAQLRSAAKIAKEHGVSVRLDTDGSITISPSTTPAIFDGAARASDALARLDVGEDDFSAALAKTDPNSRNVFSGGYLWEYNDFKAHITTKPISRRETLALEVLAEFGVGLPADARQLKVGPDTQERLEARGYIKRQPQQELPKIDARIVLTEDGLKAWKAC